MAFAYSVSLWDYDIITRNDLVAVFNFAIQYTCKGGKVIYRAPKIPPTKFDMQGAKIDSGIIPKQIDQNGSWVEFTLWAAASWYEFNKKDGFANAERIIKVFQADKSPKPLIVSIALGVYIAEGNLRAIKRTATFSKKVEIFCCKDGKYGPGIKEGKDQFIKSGDLYWEDAKKLNIDGSVTHH